MRVLLQSVGEADLLALQQLRPGAGPKRRNSDQNAAISARSGLFVHPPAVLITHYTTDGWLCGGIPSVGPWRAHVGGRERIKAASLSPPS